MEKRIQIIDDCIVVSVIIPLSPSEQAKLESKDLELSINTIAKDMRVDWAVELSGNIATVAISQVFGKVVGDKESHELEIRATNFMRAIEHLELSKPMPSEEAKHNNDEYDFIKTLIDTWEATEKNAPTTGFAILAGVDILGLQAEMPCARIPGPLAKELCMSYLKVHSHDKN